MSQKTSVSEKTRLLQKSPKLYKVIMHNDDYTTMEFVIDVLVNIFRKTPVEATKIMYDVHKNGIGIAGVFPYDIAATKIQQATNAAIKNGFPFKLSMEEE
ncbi:MAG: ATP-dependent Clp protease adaptor ClpS [Bacillota bacterium]|nr:ATP-dependent Clp protease adaptor ClpS [Bacillota bacterium]